ncbi:MAG: RDD family protein [Acidimicrobiales bacterium]
MSDQTPPGGDTPSEEGPSTPPPPAPPPPAGAPPPAYPGSAPPPPGAPPAYPGTPGTAPPPAGPPPESAPPYGTTPQYPSAPQYGSPPSYGSAPGSYGYAPGPVDRFGRPLAGWWQRFGAIFIDGLILGIPKSVIAAAVVGSSGTYTNKIGVGLVVVGIVFAIIDLVYFALLNGSQRGQTVGQMALGITVRDAETGGPIDPQRAGLRILVLIPGILLDWIPIIGVVAGIYTIIAGLSPLWDSNRQGFHDKSARTQVIRVR